MTRITEDEARRLGIETAPEPRQSRARRGSNAESELQAAIAEALQYRGCYVERRNSGAVTTAHGGRVQLSPPGTPDLFVLYRGKAFFLEVKMPGNKPTKIQRAMHETLRQHGGIVAVVTSVDEALAVLREDNDD